MPPPERLGQPLRRCVAAAAIAAATAAGAVAAPQLSTADFRDPPPSARPHTWWHWMHGHVSRAGITKDLEAMRDVGLGGLHAFHVSWETAPGPVKYLSAEWRELMLYSVEEAERLGLEFTLHNCAGWSLTGGPWVTPADAMQKVILTETRVSGPDPVEVKLPTEKIRYRHYGDIAVLAFPTPGAELDGGKGFRLSTWERKTGFRRGYREKRDTRTPPSDAVVPYDSVLVLSDRMDAEGVLRWTPPAGDWTVLRIGHTPTGKENFPAPNEGRGLECDKLSRAAVERHFDAGIGTVIEDLREHVGRTVTTVLIDSYEAGQQNWTAGFDAEFQRRKGYDLTRYLPTLTGRVVESVDRSERFLWDFRRTIADLFVENHYGAFADRCHAAGLKVAIEPYGDTGNFSDVDAAEHADLPMGEYWIDRTNPHFLATARMCASAAHAYGRPIVGAEAFTASPPTSGWRTHPAMMKPVGDRFLAAGMNRVIFHTFAHQPWRDGIAPGLTLGRFGGQFHRKNTWFRLATPYLRYLARCQHLLQRGRHVADLAYLTSGNPPHLYGGRRSLWPEPPAGHDYDVLGPKILAKLRVESGTIVTPGEARYRVLILPPEDRATPETMREVARLADAGAAIVGSPPTAAWGLSNQPEADAEVRAIGERLWAAGGGATRGGELAATLRSLGVTPDCVVTGVPQETDTDEPLVWTHRVVGEADVDFIANRTASAIDAKVSLRSSLGVPELWDAESGDAILAPHWSREGERTRVDLTLGPHSSRFVVLRGTAAVKAVVADHSAPSLPASIMITEDWHLTAGDATVDPATLTPWDENDDDAIRHFSGTAEYRVTFDAAGEPIGDGVRATLDLGEVAVIAEATLNGVPLGVAWRAPHRLDATEALRTGRNELVVRVTNLWVNALIGAERGAGHSAEGHPPNGRLVESLPTEWLDDGSSTDPEAVPIVATGWRHWSAESKLARSGLMGPVKVIFDRAPSGTPAP